MNKRLIIITSLLLVPFLFVIFNMYYYDDFQTSLLPGVFIQDKGSDLVANRWSVPLALDWNSDGKKDLLVGNRTYDEKTAGKGYISFYQNIGTDSSPIFNNFSYVKACTDICANLSVVPDG